MNKNGKVELYRDMVDAILGDFQEILEGWSKNKPKNGEDHAFMDGQLTVIEQVQERLFKYRRAANELGLLGHR